MTKFSQEDGIEDTLSDSIGVLAKKIRLSQSRNLLYAELRAQLDKAIKTSKYLVFTANVTNYGTWSVGQSRLLYVPETRRGALSIFRYKTIRLVCTGSGRFTRQLAAAAIKLDPSMHSKVIKQFEFNQEKINQKNLRMNPIQEA